MSPSLSAAEGKSLPGGSKSQDLAVLCKAVADPLRLDILRVLSHDSFGVQELASILAMPQPGMSHHLKILSKAGLVAARRQGNSIFYRRALLKIGMDFHELQQQLFATIDELSLGADVLLRIQRVYEERSALSRQYFERHATEFAEQQGSICDVDQYLPNLRELLDIMDLPRPSRVMEVGPGQGALLRELLKRCDELVALDNSEEMLTLARKNVSHPLLQFVRSSLEDYEPDQQQRFDALVLNMVLHHMASPQQIFVKLAGLLREGGCLLLADLCSHNQEWTRSSCGDVWLGFDPQDLKEWAVAAGFREQQSLYLGLKNGFQIQLQLFRLMKGSDDGKSRL